MVHNFALCVKVYISGRFCDPTDKDCEGDLLISYEPFSLHMKVFPLCLKKKRGISLLSGFSGVCV